MFWEVQETQLLREGIRTELGLGQTQVNEVEFQRRVATHMHEFLVVLVPFVNEMVLHCTHPPSLTIELALQTHLWMVTFQSQPFAVSHLQLMLLTLTRPPIEGLVHSTQLPLTIIEVLLQSHTNLSVRKVIVLAQRHLGMPLSVEATVLAYRVQSKQLLLRNIEFTGQRHLSSDESHTKRSLQAHAFPPAATPLPDWLLAVALHPMHAPFTIMDCASLQTHVFALQT
jgi:hypothetical protein